MVLVLWCWLVLLVLFIWFLVWVLFFLSLIFFFLFFSFLFLFSLFLGRTTDFVFAFTGPNRAGERELFKNKLIGLLKKRNQQNDQSDLKVGEEREKEKEKEEKKKKGNEEKKNRNFSLLLAHNSFLFFSFPLFFSLFLSLYSSLFIPLSFSQEKERQKI